MENIWNIFDNLEAYISWKISVPYSFYVSHESYLYYGMV